MSASARPAIHRPGRRLLPLSSDRAATSATHLAPGRASVIPARLAGMRNG